MSSRPEFKVFVSAVTSEAGQARDEIASDLRARGLAVRVQRDFRQEADTTTTLAKLDKYIRECSAVVHVAGKRSGAFPTDEEAARFRHLLPSGVARASYAQFEFHMARHYRRRCSIYIATGDFAAEKKQAAAGDDPALQAEHVARLERLDRDYFSSTHELCRKVLREDWPHDLIRQPRNLPFPTLGELFKGREADLDRLHAALTAKDGRAAVVGRALHGLGGVGKTRLAIEYAWRHEDEHSALLFLRADTPERLNAGLAALAGPDLLDLPEKDIPTDEVRIPAALGWLEHHPGWLLILDNVDDEAAVAAVARLMARLKGGRVIVTARATNLPAAIRTLELDVLGEEAAVAFLLERTQERRDRRPDDPEQARGLSDAVGHLALGLEQAGAYIAAERISLADYLRLWRERREAVVGWFDKTLMSYDHDTGLAASWLTSAEQLKPEDRRLLERLAYFAPGPIPTFLMEIPVPDLQGPSGRLSGLYAYSLATQVASDSPDATPSFSVHRLVQDFTRRGMSEKRRSAALSEALSWMIKALVGNPFDVRSWSCLDPLAPHALVLAEAGEAVGRAEPANELYGTLGLLCHAKARYGEAEHDSRRALALAESVLDANAPQIATRLNNLAVLLGDTNRPSEAEMLYRRALAIAEANHGPDHPNVARCLNNLALLLGEMNRFGEAEPLYRRALAIDEASYGPDHPDVATDLNNLAGLLGDTNRLDEAEPLFRRALSIDEASDGPDHPNVAIPLSNLASLLRATNRGDEAEPLFRRALAIDEASYGPDHPNVARCLNDLALLLAETGRPGEAEQLHRRALAIDEACCGPDHPNVAGSLNNLADLLGATSRSGEAKPLYRRALAILEASYGPDHPRILACRENLATILDMSADG